MQPVATPVPRMHPLNIAGLVLEIIKACARLISPREPYIVQLQMAYYLAMLLAVSPPLPRSGPLLSDFQCVSAPCRRTVQAQARA